MNKLMTLDNLYEFFVRQNRTVGFNSKASDNRPIVVSIPGQFEAVENNMPGLLRLKMKVCHTNLNRNGSYISEEHMTEALPTLKYRPILAYIHRLEDGTLDFYAHNVEITEDENGDEKITYIEKQVGCFTADEPYLEYDREQDKTYVNAFAVIPEEYTEAANIIRRKNGTKVSCELIIDALEYNAKEKYMDITSFYFGGTTLLGCDENGNEVGEGMLGSRADIADFCHEKPVFNYQDKLIETLEHLNITLQSFNDTHTIEKGGKDMDKLNELFEKYGKTLDEITFEIEGLSDEELEVKFKEAFEEEEEILEDETFDGTSEDESSDNEDSFDSDNGEEEVSDDFKKKKRRKCSVDENGDMSMSFEISHEDIRGALYNLLGIYEEEDNEWYWITNIYDSYFIFENWDGGKYYKQSYTVDGDNVAFSGDRIEVFMMVLTESEKLAVEQLREKYAVLEAQYNELKNFKDQYDADQIKIQKDAVFAKAEYEILKDDEAFKLLKSDADQYSVEEIEAKAKAVFADFVIKNGQFSSDKSKEKDPKVHGIPFEKKGKKKSGYGNLFPG